MADDRTDPVPEVRARMTEPFEAGVVVRDLELMERCCHVSGGVSV